MQSCETTSFTLPDSHFLKQKPVELRFTPVDNQRLANLCGVLDENLRQIEAALEVSIARRGERFSLRGDPGNTARAAQVLMPHGPPGTPRGRRTGLRTVAGARWSWPRTGARGTSSQRAVRAAKKHPLGRLG